MAIVVTIVVVRNLVVTIVVVRNLQKYDEKRWKK